MNNQNAFVNVAGKTVNAANFYKAGNKLFTSGNLMLAPSAISSILRTAGIPVPKGVEVSLESAQILMAGGQIVSNVETGASIGSYVTPVGAAVEATLKLGEAIGWLDSKSPAVQAVELGLDLALVVAGGGLNVLADIKLVFDVVANIQASANAAEVVKGEANSLLQKFIYSRQKPQRDALAVNYAKYQNGQMSVFELMGAVAIQSPDLFPNFFPQLQAFMPAEILHVCALAGESTLFGGYRDYTACTDIKTTMATKGTVQNAILQAYVFNPLLPFYDLDKASIDHDSLLKYGFPKESGINSHANPVHRISTHSLALLSMFPPYIDFIGKDFNIVPILQSLDLTPSDIEGSPLFDEINYGYFGGASDFFPKAPLNSDAYKGNYISSDSTYYGAEPQGVQVVVDDSKLRQYAMQNPDPNKDLEQKILDLDNWREFDSSSKLMSIPQSYKIIREWGVLPDLPSQDEKPQWRYMSNYWASLSLLEKIRKDKFFNDISQNLPDMAQYLNKFDDFQTKHRELQFKIVGRKLNFLAKMRIAKFLNTTVNNISQLNDPREQMGAVFALKGA